MRVYDAEKRAPLVAQTVEANQTKAAAEREDRRIQAAGLVATVPLGQWFTGMQKIEQALKGRPVHLRKTTPKHRLGAGALTMVLTQKPQEPPHFYPHQDRDPFNPRVDPDRFLEDGRRQKGLLSTTVYFRPEGEYFVQPLHREVVVKLGDWCGDEKEDHGFPEELCAAYGQASIGIELPADVAPEEHAAKIAAEGTITWLPFYMSDRSSQQWSGETVAAAQQRFEPVRNSLAGTYDTLLERAEHPRTNPGLAEALRSSEASVFLRDANIVETIIPFR